VTLVDAPPSPILAVETVDQGIDDSGPFESTDRSEPGTGGLTRRRVIGLAVLSLVVFVIAVTVVLYAVGPLVHNRDQRRLMDSERQAINLAAHDNQGLYHAALPTAPPVPGTAVGILAIPAIGLQQAVVEGVGPSQTVAGPGHVPGTAGLGQPGNSSVVGRRSAYGGPFGDLGELHPGDRVIAATTEGQSVYVVRSVRDEALVTRPASALASSEATTTTLGRHHVTTTTVAGGHGSHHTTASTLPKPAITGPATVSFQTLYGPSTKNQITLVTSASGVPWNADDATVVVATMQTKPFTPTIQESRSPSQQGNSGDPSALAWLLLALLGLAAVLIGAVAVYRHCTVRSAYLLTTAPLLALTVLAAEAASHLLPAWL
jgi:sortase A